MPATLDSRLSRWCPAIAVAALTVWLFGATLIGTRTFVFRDAAHYFAPLFQYNVSEWRAGRVPLWNPYEGIGMPQLAENTASVFYPAQALLLLPVDFYWAYNIYVVSHVLLAAWGAYRLARHLGTSHLAGGQAALAYAFSGSVLFQYCNVIFLIGAAWLPFALQATDKLLRGGGLRSAAALGFCWAMMVLGGDAQMAYNAALLAGAYALYLSWTRAASAGVETPKSRTSRFFAPGGWLLGAGTIAFALAAVQILPTWELAAMSPRASYDLPRSLWEVAAWKLRGDERAGQGGAGSKLGALVDASLGGEHLERVYEFSVAPWRWPELLWANFGGRQFPEHRRWMSALPWEGRIWSPSLYCGAIAIVLAWGGWRQRRQDSRLRCCGWMTLWAVAAALGEYGFGWLLHTCSATGPHGLSGVGSELGGVYWLMNLMLPGYVCFRYPAKLYTIAALGISLLAARGWDSAFTNATPAARSGLRWLSIISLGGILFILLFPSPLARLLSHADSDPLFGPLDVRGALDDVLLGLLQTAVVSAVGACLLLAKPGRAQTAAAIGLLLVSAADLAAAHRWLVPTVEAAVFLAEPAVTQQIYVEDPTDPMPRIFRDRYSLPADWAKSSSPDRLTEMLQRDRETFWPKYHLPLGIGSLQSSGMLVPDAYTAVWDIAWKPIEHRGHHVDRVVPDTSVLELLGARFVVMQTEPFGQMTVDQYQPWSLIDDSLLCVGHRMGMDLRLNEKCQPRAWLVHRVDTLPPLADNSPRRVRARTEEVLFPKTEPRYWPTDATIETAIAQPGSEVQSSSSSRPESSPASGFDSVRHEETCDLAISEPQRVVVDAELASPGLVVLSDMFYPGWEVTVEGEAGTRPGEILRTNRVMRGVWLEAGKHRLEFRYRPATFRWGAAISGAAWLLGAVGLIGAAIAARKTARPPEAIDGKPSA